MAANDDRIYVTEPAGDYWEFAISQDGTFATIGPWQNGPTEDDTRSFESLPDGSPFEVGKPYVIYGRDEDPARRNTTGYDAVIEVTFTGDGATNPVVTKVTLQIATDNGRHTDNIIDAAGFEAPGFEMAENPTNLLTAQQEIYTENGQEYIRWRIMKCDTEEVIGGQAPTAPVIEDQTIIVGEQFSFQWPEFSGALRYSVTEVFPELAINLSPDVRKITGVLSKDYDDKEVTIIGYSATGKAAPVTFVFHVVQPEARFIREVYFKPENGGVRLFLFGNGGQPGIRLRVLDNSGNEVVNTLWAKDPGKWSAPGLFNGTSDYTYLISTLADGTYTVESQLVSSSTVYSVPMVLAANGEGKKIYPVTKNLFLNKPYVATGVQYENDINDGNIETDVVFALGPNAAMQGTISEGPLKAKVEFIRVHRATSFADEAQSIAGAYLIVGDGTSIDKTLDENLNVPGVKWGRLPIPIPNDPFIDIRSDQGDWGDIETSVYLFQAVDAVNQFRVAKEIEVYGTIVANDPPKLLKPIPSVVIEEGDSGEMDLSQFVQDTDPISYAGILNGNIAMPSWMEVNSALKKLIWTSAPYQGVPGQTQVYYPLNIVFSDTGNNQIVVPMTSGFFVKRKNTAPAEFKLLIGAYDNVTQALTPFLDVTGGNWVFNLRGVDVDYTRLNNVARSEGPYTTPDDPVRTTNRKGSPFTDLTLGKTYELGTYKPGSNPLVIYRSPFKVEGGKRGIVFYDNAPTSAEKVEAVYLDAAALDRQHIALVRGVASGPVKLRVEKVGSGYDTGYQTGTLPAGKTDYEYNNNTVLADGDYIAYAQLISDPTKQVSVRFTVKTQAQRMTIYPANVTNNQMLSIGLAFKVSPQTAQIEVLKPVPATPGTGDDIITLGAGQTFSGSDDTHRTTYGSGNYNTYKFDESHEYKFRLKGQTAWISTTPYARNGDGQGVRRDVWPKSTTGDGTGTPGNTEVEGAATTWITAEQTTD